MRLVHERAELRSALEAAKSEAARAFGDDEVYIEKAIVHPRHIEMQILADEHGHIVYLGERRVLDSAKAPENIGGSAIRCCGRRHAAADGRGCRACRAGLRTIRTQAPSNSWSTPRRISTSSK